MAVASFASTISALFMIKAVLLFEPCKDEDGSEATKRGNRRSPGFFARISDGKDSMKWDMSHMPSRRVAFRMIVALGFVWSVIGAALLFSACLVQGHLAIAYSAFSAACFTIAVTTTHGLGGRLMYARQLEEAAESTFRIDDTNRWRFFQPFQGSTAFIATQAAGWLLYSSSLAFSLWVAIMLACGVAQRVKSLHLALGGATAVMAEIILAASLLAWNASGERPTWRWTKKEWRDKIKRANDLLNHVTIITVLYLNIHVPVALLMLFAILLPPYFFFSTFIGLVTIYYAITGFDSSNSAGRREWPAFQEWLGVQTQRWLPAWLGSFEVVLDSPETREEDFNPSFSHDRYVFGFVPHGLYPLSAGYLPFTPAFKRLLPWLRPCTLTASVTFQTPIIRDVMRWCGMRVVSRFSFKEALEERGSVIVVPGGQAELVETWRMCRRDNPEFCLYTKHKGFVRIALEQGACLVPILCFGEARSLRNLIDVPRMQRWTYRRLGFPIPFLIVGKYGILPLPSRAGLRFVVGRPIRPPKEFLKRGKEPSAQQVDAMHRKFYEEVEHLWLRHRGQSPGFEDMPLVMI